MHLSEKETYELVRSFLSSSDTSTRKKAVFIDCVPNCRRDVCVCVFVQVFKAAEDRHQVRAGVGGVGGGR